MHTNHTVCMAHHTHAIHMCAPYNVCFNHIHVHIILKLHQPHVCMHTTHQWHACAPHLEHDNHGTYITHLIHMHVHILHTWITNMSYKPIYVHVHIKLCACQPHVCVYYTHISHKYVCISYSTPVNHISPITASEQQPASCLMMKH